MHQELTWRVKVLAWGNLFIGVGRPLGAAVNILSAMRVFSFDYARGSIIIATLLGMALGILNWRSGRWILQNRPRAFRQACVAGGFTFGYTFLGTVIMTTDGYNGDLMILYQNGSTWWWNWTLSHFQDSCLREIPLMVWWVLGMGTIIRDRLPGAPKATGDRVAKAAAMVFCFVLLGMGARILQFAEDGMLSSQR